VLQVRVSGRGADVDARHRDAATTESVSRMGGNGDAAPAAELWPLGFAAASGRLVRPLSILHATPVAFCIHFGRNRLLQ